MSKITKILIGVVLVVIVVLILTNSKSNNREGSIRIGAVLGLTGYASTDSLNVKRGIDLAIEDLSKAGIKVDINYQDDKTDPKETVSAIRYLASQFKPQVIIGPIWSYLESAGEPSLTELKIVAYAPANTSEYASNGPFMVHGASKTAYIVDVVHLWLQKNNIKKVAIITTKDGWGDVTDKAFKEASKKANVEIVLDDAILSQSDSASITNTDIAKAKSLGAQAILFTSYDEGATIIAKKRKQLNFNVPVLVHSQVYPQLLSRGAVTKEELVGIDNLTTKMSQEFIKKFKDKYGEVPGTYADRAYDGTVMLAKILNENPNISSEEIVSKLKNGFSYEGYAGKYQFDKSGDPKTQDWVIEPVLK